jgi:hypothetical protein
METIVKITWDEPKQQDWLCADNISLALHAYCKNTKFKVEEVSIPMAELVDTGIDVPTEEEITQELQSIFKDYHFIESIFKDYHFIERDYAEDKIISDIVEFIQDEIINRNK